MTNVEKTDGQLTVCEDSSKERLVAGLAASGVSEDRVLARSPPDPILKENHHLGSPHYIILPSQADG
jgi:hypothetical protein